MPSTSLSDKALAVFAFAAYHQLSSGEAVVNVVLTDGAGHSADPAAIGELENSGLLQKDGERATFTQSGKAKLAAVIAALQGS